VVMLQKPDNTPDVAVGELIALIVESGEDWKNVTVPAAATAAAPSATDTQAAPTDSGASVTATSMPAS